MDEAPSRPPVATHWPGDFPSALDPGRFWQSASTRVLLGGLVLLLMLGAATLGLMWRERTEVEQRDRHRLEQLAGVMDAYVTQVFESSNLVLDNLAESLLQNPQALAQLPAQQGYYLQILPFLRSLALVDAQGRVLLSTSVQDQGGQVQVQRWLTAPSAAGHSMVIGPWTPGHTLVAQAGAPATAGGFIPLLRRVALGAGREVYFIAQLNPEVLATFQHDLASMAPTGTRVLLVRDDGQALVQVNLSASRVQAPQAAASESARAQLQQRWAQAMAQGWKNYQGGYGSAQENVLGVWHRSDTQPLMSVVEQPYEASVQRWRETVRGPLAFMAMALALLLFMTAISWRNARLREQAQRQRYAAMHEIQLREQELSQLFANVQELIFRTDPQGVIEFANARWSALSMQGRALYDWVAPEYRQAVQTLFNPAGPKGLRATRAQVQLSGADRRTLDISVTPLHDRAGQLRGYAGSAVDVTALLRAQHHVQEQLALTRQLLDNTPLPISLMDMQGRFVTVNQAWEEFMGLSRQQVLGHTNVEFLPPAQAQAYDAHNAELLRTGEAQRYQERIQRSDGTWRDISLIKVRVHSHDGTPLGLLSVKMDITEHLQAREQVQQAMRTQSEFVANISHELRTPLQSILGFSELGALRARPHDKLAGMFDNIHAAGQRMLALVNDLLDLAKIESTVGGFQFGRHDLRDLIDDLAAELHIQLQARQLHLQLNLGRMPLVAKIDPVRFGQVLRNVLANAIKFSPSGASIEVRAGLDDAESDNIHITISDHGPGIPAAELETIFQAFIQSSKTSDGSGGTGLGLAICHKIMQAHSGRIYATNAPQGGAQFHLIVPTAQFTDTMPASLL